MAVRWPPEPLRLPVRPWTCGQRFRVPHNPTAATTTIEAVNSCATKTGQLDALATARDQEPSGKRDAGAQALIQPSPGENTKQRRRHDHPAEKADHHKIATERPFTLGLPTLPLASSCYGIVQRGRRVRVLAHAISPTGSAMCRPRPGPRVAVPLRK